MNKNLNQYSDEDMSALRMAVAIASSQLRENGLPYTDERVKALRRLGAKLVGTSIEYGYVLQIDPDWPKVAKEYR